MVASMPPALEIVDVVGVGLNATDTLIRLPRFPSFNTKMQVLDVAREAGGQVASALVACRRWGLSARYIGSIGDDEAGAFQRQELERNGVEAHWLVTPGVRSQFAYILIDRESGERTILWGRDPRLEIHPEQLDRKWIERARLLHVDGHDAGAAAAAACWARAAGIPVVADLDHAYQGTKDLLPYVDYLLASAEFPSRLTGESDLAHALRVLAERYPCRVAGATLGERGALAWDGTRYHYEPGFVVGAVDTTGAGDIFHAGYIYGLLAGWDVGRSLEFACASAALNCTATGARGGIHTVAEIQRFIAAAARREHAFELDGLGRGAARRR
ncbi:MAG TPA: PfkB family carbohydrate kinase [Candidatus Acidoferrales bacterium]|nr:PfkB family carbohydrate kinase [Candidatus Acidoferrales bacterium]